MRKNWVISRVIMVTRSGRWSRVTWYILNAHNSARKISFGVQNSFLAMCKHAQAPS